MPRPAVAPVDLSPLIDPTEPFEAVLLLTSAGRQLGAWTRNPASVDVLTVMAATLFGSIETLVVALGAASPEEVAVVVGGRRLLAVKLNSQVILVVVATADKSAGVLRAARQRLVRKLPALVQKSWSPPGPVP